eukprot:jgi/Chlat1/2946/Chrsp2S08910
MTAISAVLESIDLLRAIVSALSPCDRARVACVNRTWRRATQAAEEEYYRCQWPAWQEGLKLHVGACYSHINTLKHFRSQALPEGFFLAFCLMHRKDGQLLFVPKPYEDCWTPTWARGANFEYINQYVKPTHGAVHAPAAEAARITFVQECEFEVFTVRVSDGEVYHARQECCFVEARMRCVNLIGGGIYHVVSGESDAHNNMRRCMGVYGLYFKNAEVREVVSEGDAEEEEEEEQQEEKKVVLHRAHWLLRDSKEQSSVPAPIADAVAGASSATAPPGTWSMVRI